MKYFQGTKNISLHIMSSDQRIDIRILEKDVSDALALCALSQDILKIWITGAIDYVIDSIDEPQKP